MRAVPIFIVTVLVGAFGLSPWIERIDFPLLDAQFRLLRTHALRPVKQDVVIVGFNEETGRSLREPMVLWHPHFGRFLEATAVAGAAGVGLDLVLPDHSVDSIVPGYDRKLLEGLITARRSSPLVLALTIDPSGETRRIYPAFTSAAGKDSGGYVLYRVDADGVTRRFTERLGEDGSVVPTLAGQLARRLGREAEAGIVDFAVGPAFDFVPLQDVISWHAAGNGGKLKEVLGGKVVLLGSVLQFEDRIRLPVNLVGWEPQAHNSPGVLLHAQVLRNLLNGGLIKPLPAWLVAILCLAMVSAWWLARNVWIGGAVVSAGVMGVLAVSTYGLTRGWYLPPAAISMSLFVVVATRISYDSALRLRERLKLRRAFAGYVSPDVMEEIIAGHLNPEPGGTNKFVCVMFSDIRGYTTRSENMSPQQLIAFLNRYFERVVEIIHSYSGTLVCFMGDGIMVLFGAPKSLADPCDAAFECARDLLHNVKRFNATLAADEPPVDIGIGLHAGEAVVGNVGSTTRINFTALGDVTNVASRLEGLTKEVGYRLVFSEAVAGKLRNRRDGVPLGPQAIKGHTPVPVYGYEKV